VDRIDRRTADDGSSDRRRLRARAPGKATITVAMGDVHTTVDVEVVP
jgi:hypothetical protein